MTAISILRGGSFFPRRAQTGFSDSGLISAVSVPLLLGLCSGAVVGLYSEAVPAALASLPLLSAAAIPETFWQALLKASQFIIAAGFLSASLFGVALIPLLGMLRGFVFGCVVAAVFSASAYAGLLHSLLLLGLPALLGFPSFILAACDSFRLSRGLWPSKRGARAGHLLGHALIVLLLTLAETFYTWLILPTVLEKFF